MADKNVYSKMSGVVLEECTKAVQAMDDNQVKDYLELVLDADRVFFVGVGRVMLELEAIAKRYAHLGIRAVVVGEITEPAITERDVLVVGSGSGETLYPLGIARKAKQYGAKVIHIGSNPECSMAKVRDLFVRIPVKSRAGRVDEIESWQPMTSLFEQSLLLFGDVTAMMMIEEKGLEIETLWQYHANLE